MSFANNLHIDICLSKKLFATLCHSFHVSFIIYKYSWDLIFFITQHVVVLLIMDMESAKSDVNGRTQKYDFCYFKL